MSSDDPLLGNVELEDCVWLVIILSNAILLLDVLFK